MNQICTGNGVQHCCWVDGEVCPHLVENKVPGRRWACGLLDKFGSWAGVNESDEYEPIGAHWLTIGAPFNYCESFKPTPAQCCQVGD